MDRSWFAVYLTLGCLVAGVLPQYREKNTSEGRKDKRGAIPGEISFQVGVAFERGCVARRQKGNNKRGSIEPSAFPRRDVRCLESSGYAIVASKGYN
ncbi:low affinity immunoglobulin epsilon Fc receptor-like isoform X2, partial [Vespula squamosa]